MSTEKITQQMIDDARQRVGEEPKRGRQHHHQATIDAIKFYSAGIGDDNPLWLNPEYGKQTKWGTLIAPPTFMWSQFASNLIFPSESKAKSSGKGFPGMSGLYPGGRWKFERPIRLDEKLRSTVQRIAIVDVDNRVDGDFVKAPPGDIEDGIRASRAIFPAEGKPIVIEVDEHRCYNAETDELIGTSQEYLARIEPYAVEPSEGKFAHMGERIYTEEEMAQIDEAYSQEGPRRAAVGTRYWDDVNVGDEVPPLIKGPLTLLSYMAFLTGYGGFFVLTDRLLYNFRVRFADSVTADRRTNIPTVPLEMHWQEEQVRRLSYPLGFDFGSMRVPWHAHHVTDWMGDAGWLKDFVIWFDYPFLLSHTCWMRGRVVGKEPSESGDGEGIVNLELEAVNFDGERISHGTASVALPRRGDA